MREKAAGLPRGPGVYLMKDRLGRVLYVGKAKDLRKRVGSYFQPSRRDLLHQPKVRAMVELVENVEVIEVRNEAEALLLEGKLIKEWKPKYNTDFTDDKRFLLVRVDLHHELPRFRLVRNRVEDGARYFGPFAHAGPLRQTLAEMRRRFGILLADARPLQQDDGRWKLYEDARAEIYGHANLVTEVEYAERVARACAFLEGQSREWLRQIEAEMKSAAAEQKYEKAAELRDIAWNLNRTLRRTRKFARDPMRPENPRETLRELQEALAMDVLPEHIECFDISHISGTFVVASMVRFTGGLAEKAQYRRFKIRTFVGNDDYRAMEEVVGRRYLRLHEEGRPFPELVVIDGGAGQLQAALKAFLAHGLEPPLLIGLAKKKESIHFTDGRDPLELPHREAALRLLQRVRDEAHRFANAFNAELRSQRLRESILDDFTGLGKVRRAALMERFGTLARLRQASAEELQEVEGIGPKLAARLKAFLDEGRGNAEAAL